MLNLQILNLKILNISFKTNIFYKLSSHPIVLWSDDSVELGWSSLVKVNGKEPEYTNCVFIRGKDAKPEGYEFIECIDYIFVSKQSTIINCLPLNLTREFQPNSIESSDHKTIGCELNL